MTPNQAASALVIATMAMHEHGIPLMHRVVPMDMPLRLWDHYPLDDVTCPVSGARYFYHLHPEHERGPDEHGHFHLFLPQRAMPAGTAPLRAPAGRVPGASDHVHVAGLSIDRGGLPCSLFTVNRWVTDEWMFGAAAITSRLDRFDLAAAPGDPLVNAWLTAMVALCAREIAEVIEQRDRVIAAEAIDGDDRAFEMLSSLPIDLQALIDRHL